MHAVVMYHVMFLHTTNVELLFVNFVMCARVMYGNVMSNMLNSDKAAGNGQPTATLSQVVMSAPRTCSLSMMASHTSYVPFAGNER